MHISAALGVAVLGTVSSDRTQAPGGGGTVRALERREDEEVLAEAA